MLKIITFVPRLLFALDIADPEQLWQELAKLGLRFDAPTLAQP